ncbi:hypothetical protein AAVH_43059 [Aphelenchoides avenae]|nr:hypothetical protein AAVH_43059 [Aphelenchus avenae]
MFEMTEPGTDIVRSVTLLYKRPLFEVSPLPDADEPLGRPRRTDAPSPHSAFIKEWSQQRLHDYDNTITESPAADLFVFENAKAAKKLEVFVLAIQQDHNDEYNDEHNDGYGVVTVTIPVTNTVTITEAVHYAFLLQVVDMQYPSALPACIWPCC